MDNPQAALYAVVALATKDLSELELAVLNNCAQMDMDPRDQIGSDKWSHLFKEANGMRMANDVKDALARIVLQRLT